MRHSGGQCLPRCSLTISPIPSFDCITACKMYKDAQRTDFRRVQCAADVAGALHLTRAWGSTDGGSQWDWATELA
jgi:hypothetical protein